MEGYDHEVLDRTAAEIVQTAKDTLAEVHGPIPLPTRIERYTVLRSPAHRPQEPRAVRDPHAQAADRHPAADAEDDRGAEQGPEPAAGSGHQDSRDQQRRVKTMHGKTMWPGALPSPAVRVKTNSCTLHRDDPASPPVSSTRVNQFSGTAGQPGAGGARSGCQWPRTPRRTPPPKRATGTAPPLRDRGDGQDHRPGRGSQPGPQGDGRDRPGGLRRQDQPAIDARRRADVPRQPAGRHAPHAPPRSGRRAARRSSSARREPATPALGTKRTDKRRGGGTAKGPKPRDYEYHLPKKAVRAATRMAILSKFLDKEALVIDELALTAPEDEGNRRRSEGDQDRHARRPRPARRR